MSKQSTVPEDIANMSFEIAMKELETIVEQLDSGQVELDKSIEIYTRGALLKQHCEEKLRSAQERVDKIVTSESGMTLQPANIE
jgi:exodeoxyribonuclease VII small subunit